MLTRETGACIIALVLQDHSVDTAKRSKALLQEHLRTVQEQTDRLMALLMLAQWAFAIIAAIWISPQTWTGPLAQTSINVWAAVVLGGLLNVGPQVLVRTHP